MSPRFHVGFLLFFSITLIFVKLGGNGLANYDDCFYAQKAKEIVNTGDWMTMHYNHKPAFENPPFYMWLVVLSYKAFGISEYAAKFPSALMGVATILLIYFFTKKMFGAWSAFASSFILSTTYVFIRYARHAMIDVTLTFFFCLAMVALYYSLHNHRKYFILWGFAIAACILAKSILGFFPMVVSVGFLLLTKRWKVLFDPYFVVGSAIALLVGCQWYAHEISLFGKEFINVHFGWLIIQRGFSQGEESWYGHLSYFRDLVTYYWPWLPLLIVGYLKFVNSARAKNENAILLLAWFTLPIVTLSVMSSRVLWYIMPVFPAAAIIGGATLHQFFDERKKETFVKGCVAVGALLFIVFLVLPTNLEANREQDIRVLSPYVKHFASQGAELIAFREDYYGLNNALLFYSDYGASAIPQDYQELSKVMSKPDTVVCIVRTQLLPELKKNIPTAHLIRATEEIALISNARLDISTVKTW
jgi:4-amino-4-deoxy-L-arabinose transferase-like glycosyltransferase